MSDTPSRTLAVALHYDAPNAPIVVATGRGHVGQKIIEVAREHGVPLEQNAALAEALSTIPLDDQIPEQLYVAVAQIIGFIMRSGSRRGLVRPPAQAGPAG